MARVDARLSAAALLAAACVAAAAPAWAQGGPGSYFGEIHERHLDNGMTVLVQEDHRIPIVSLSIRYDYGEGAVPRRREGAPFVTTLLMVDRSQHLAPGEAARLFARAGAGARGDSTTQLVARQWVTVPAHQLALPLWVWSDQMGFFDGAIDDAAVASLRGRAMAMRSTALEGEPLGRLDQIACEELFPDTHPLHFAELSPESLAGVDRASVVAFHDAWMTPDHATLAIVGDVWAPGALAQVGRYFGTIPRGAAPGRPRWEPPPRLEGEVTVDVAAGVPRPWVSIRWPTPRYLSDEDATLDVTVRWLRGERNAFLFWKLVDERKVAVSVRVRHRSSIAGSQLEVTIEGAAGKSPAELLAAFDASVDEILRGQPSALGLRSAVYETLITHLLDPERSERRAAEYAAFSALTGHADRYWHDFERFDRVTAAGVHDAIARLLPRDRRVVLLVTPTPGAARGGERGRRRLVLARTP